MQLLGDYDLQFGVLALRLFFVSGDQLVTAISEWEAQDGLSLAELLVRSGRISLDESKMIEDILPPRTNSAPGAQAVAASVAVSPAKPTSKPVRPDVDKATADAISGTIRLDEITSDTSSLDIPLPKAVRDQLAATPAPEPPEPAGPSVLGSDVSVDDSVTGTLRPEQFLPPTTTANQSVSSQRPKPPVQVRPPSNPKSAMSRLFGWLRKDR